MNFEYTVYTTKDNHKYYIILVDKSLLSNGMSFFKNLKKEAALKLHVTEKHITFISKVGFTVYQLIKPAEELAKELNDKVVDWKAYTWQEV